MSYIFCFFSGVSACAIEWVHAIIIMIYCVLDDISAHVMLLVLHFTVYPFKILVEFHLLQKAYTL